MAEDDDIQYVQRNCTLCGMDYLERVAKQALLPRCMECVWYLTREATP